VDTDTAHSCGSPRSSSGGRAPWVADHRPIGGAGNGVAAASGAAADAARIDRWARAPRSGARGGHGRGGAPNPGASAAPPRWAPGAPPSQSVYHEPWWSIGGASGCRRPTDDSKAGVGPRRRASPSNQRSAGGREPAHAGHPRDASWPRRSDKQQTTTLRRLYPGRIVKAAGIAKPHRRHVHAPTHRGGATLAADSSGCANVSLYRSGARPRVINTTWGAAWVTARGKRPCPTPCRPTRRRWPPPPAPSGCPTRVRRHPDPSRGPFCRRAPKVVGQIQGVA